MQNERLTRGTVNEGAAPPIAERFKVGWRAHAGIDDPGPVTLQEQKDMNIIERWATEMYYVDWYHSAGVIFFAVAMSHCVTLFGMGWSGLAVVLAFCTTHYKTSIKRFHQRARDDILRKFVESRFETDHESANWLNHFVARFWLIYEPVLCALSMTAIDDVLSAFTPAFLDSLRLTQLTLGTKAPRIEKVYTSPRTENDVVQMVWEFSFTPNDFMDITPREARSKVNPQLVLEARVGNGRAVVSTPILVEDIEFSGVIHIKFKLMTTFPYVQCVEFSFLVPPLFNYVLKPLGGNRLGFQIPGLSSFIRDTVHGALQSMYDPNVFTLNIEQLLSGIPLDTAIGVLQVTIFDVQGLRGNKVGGGAPDPYVSLTIDNRSEMAKTKVRRGTHNPHWGEVRFLLVNSLMETLDLTILDYNDRGKDTYLGRACFELSNLTHNTTHEGLVCKILKDGKERGEIRFDVSFFPAIEPQMLGGGNIQALPETRAGIVRLVIHQAKELEASQSRSGGLNPFAKLLISGSEIHKTRVMKHTLIPLWESSKEFLVTDRVSTIVTIRVLDDRKSTKDFVIGHLNIRLKDLLAAHEKQQDWFPLSGCKSGKVRVSATWKPLNTAGSMRNAAFYSPPIGVVRLQIKCAKDIKNVKATLGGRNDPYVRVVLNGIRMAQTEVKNNNLNPEWNQILYVPVHNLREILYLECMAYQPLAKDRSVGFVELTVSRLAQITEDELIPYAGTGKCDIVAPLRLDKGGSLFKGELHYSADFIPALPLQDVSFPILDDILNAIDHAESAQEWVEDLESYDKISVSRSYEAISRVPSQLTVDSEGYGGSGHKPQNTHTTEFVVTNTESELDTKTLVDEQNQNGVQMSTEELLNQQSGILVFNIIEGRIAKKARLEVLLDDGYWPVFATEKADNTRVHWGQVGESFIKELDFGRVWLRLNENDEGEKESIVAELKINLKRFLEEALVGPATFTLINPDGKNKSTVCIQAKYVPVKVGLDPKDIANNMGVLRVELIDGRELHAADRNGKSDPFVIFSLNGSRGFKSQVKKKTLTPEWNEAFEIPVPSRIGADLLLEVFDWNQIGGAESLGSSNIDIAGLVSFEDTVRHVPLSSRKHGEKGIIQIRLLFRPQVFVKTRTKTATFWTPGRDMTYVEDTPLEAGGATQDHKSHSAVGQSGMRWIK
ncbi:unnamed protein product [Rhizoctonia solani]|uniref:Uncharacterized protein n=1 Tax=Rhizoctonia solani TaxID=456999 RepID=A0A8H3DMX4_9AGAM|nr:unnamed protein product [Rhizoctonia solani]